MKNLFFTALLLLIGTALFSQQTKWEYYGIWIGKRIYSNSVTAHIDSGQHINYMQSNEIKDETGKKIIFNSIVDALNYMGNKGWELVVSYNGGAENADAVYFIFKREMIFSQEVQKP